MEVELESKEEPNELGISIKTPELETVIMPAQVSALVGALNSIKKDVKKLNSTTNDLYDGILAAKANTDDLATVPPSKLRTSHWIPYLAASDELQSCREGIGAAMIQLTRLSAVFQASVSVLPEFAAQGLSIETGQDPIIMLSVLCKNFPEKCHFASFTAFEELERFGLFCESFSELSEFHENGLLGTDDVAEFVLETAGVDVSIFDVLFEEGLSRRICHTEEMEPIGGDKFLFLKTVVDFATILNTKGETYDCLKLETKTLDIYVDVFPERFVWLMKKAANAIHTFQKVTKTTLT